jgi:hypothetical protein
VEEIAASTSFCIPGEGVEAPLAHLEMVDSDTSNLVARSRLKARAARTTRAKSVISMRLSLPRDP